MGLGLGVGLNYTIGVRDMNIFPSEYGSDCHMSEFALSDPSMACAIPYVC